MNTIHNVRVFGPGTGGSVVVFSHVAKKKYYLSFRVGNRGTVDFLSKIEETPSVNKEFRGMGKVNDAH